MKIKSGFILREVGGEYIVVPVGERSKNFQGMISLNQTGAFLWKFYSTKHTQEEAVLAILDEYDVEEEIARTDVQAFENVVLTNGFAE